MSTDLTDLEQQLRATLGRTADQVTEAPRPALSWEQPAAGGQVTVLASRRVSRVRTVARYAAPLAVAAAIAAVVVLPGQEQPGDGQARAGATATLQEVALLAPASTVPLQPGQYLYSRETMALDKATAIFEVWRPQHATDPWTRRDTYLDPATGQPVLDQETGLPSVPMTQTGPCGGYSGGDLTCDDVGSMDDPTPQFLATLPTDPAQLYQQLQTWAVDRDRANMAKYPATDWNPRYEDQDVLAQTTINAIIEFARATNGMSQPFSARLQQALATMPGAVAGHETNLAGEGVVSYSAATVNSDGHAGMTNTLVFDADGNFIGTPYSEIVVGTADTAGIAPPTE